MRKRFYGAVSESFFQVLAIGADSGGCLSGDIRQLGIEVDIRRDMDRPVEGIEHNMRDMEQIVVGLDGFDSRRDLKWVRGVDDHNPVATAEERDLLVQLDAPVYVWGLSWGLGMANRSSEVIASSDRIWFLITDAHFYLANQYTHSWQGICVRPVRLRILDFAGPISFALGPE